MKKLMMATAVVCAAVAANATSVKWGLNSGETLDATKVDKGTFYLVYTTGSMDWSAFTKEAGSSYSKSDLYAAGATDVFDSFSYASGTVNSSTTIAPTTTGPDSKAAIGGGGKSFYFVCIDDGGKDIAYTASAKVASITPSPMTADATALASAFSYEHIEDKPGPEPIPEPTSGLLLLLGMAGLALRRKQK